MRGEGIREPQEGEAKATGDGRGSVQALPAPMEAAWSLLDVHSSGEAALLKLRRSFWRSLQAASVVDADGPGHAGEDDEEEAEAAVAAAAAGKAVSHDARTRGMENVPASQQLSVPVLAMLLLLLRQAPLAA